MNKFKFLAQPRVFQADTGAAVATPTEAAASVETPAAPTSLLSEAASQGKPPVPAEGGSAPVGGEAPQSQGGEAPALLTFLDSPSLKGLRCQRKSAQLLPTF